MSWREQRDGLRSELRQLLLRQAKKRPELDDRDLCDALLGAEVWVREQRGIADVDERPCHRRKR